MEPRNTDAGAPTSWDARKAKPYGPQSRGSSGLHAVEDPVHVSNSLCTRIGRSSARPFRDGWMVRGDNPTGAMRQ